MPAVNSVTTDIFYGMRLLFLGFTLGVHYAISAVAPCCAAAHFLERIRKLGPSCCMHCLVHVEKALMACVAEVDQ